VLHLDFESKVLFSILEVAALYHLNHSVCNEISLYLWMNTDVLGWLSAICFHKIILDRSFKF
jgi:hypothetical protein